jgi:tRNA(fMet)-specific endonuclease VapC
MPLPEIAKKLTIMSGSYILDTNIVIALFENDSNVRNKIVQAELVYIPSIVIGELIYGALNSGNPDKNIKRINEFSREVQILSCDFETAYNYGIIKKKLKDKGTPIPENDIWIAALSKQFKLTLVSRDSHLLNIDELDLLKW